MSFIFNRIVELVAWVVLGVSLMLLIAAHHIDNYKPPEPTSTTQSSRTV